MTAKPTLREKLTFMEFEERMHKLSLKKRKEIIEKRKNYCKLLKETMEK